MEEERRVWPVSVRELVEFVLRRGDLGGAGGFSSPGRALEGTRGHQRVQAGRPEGYETEVAVRLEVRGAECVVRVQGRIDGVLEGDDGVLIEEIKTVAGVWNSEADPLHWAQARIYGHLYLQTRPELTGCGLQLTYLELRSGAVTEVREERTRAELEEHFGEIIGVYLAWMDGQERWRRERDRTIAALPFPFSAYRAGQRTMAVAVYRRLLKPGRLFVEAPTGIGKTISACFPAVKALGQGKVEKVFYLTAKTPGRANAEQALAELRRAGLRCRSVTLTAREKICFKEEGAARCDRAVCPYALGYHDRIRPALEECLEEESLTREVIEAMARRHQVCPYELSLDASVWMDVVIGDYNHVFDPGSQVKRFFAEGSDRYALLVDEAHNLVDRAREMFSASIGRRELLGVKRELRKEAPGCARVLGRVKKRLLELRGEEKGARVFSVKELPGELVAVLREFVQAAEAWLSRDEPGEFREVLMELYFRARAFVRTADLYDERYVTIVSPDSRDVLVKLYCVDPSELMRQALKGRSAVFFSATLSPLDYYRDLLGGDAGDPSLRLGCPFPAGRLGVMVGRHVGTRFKERESSYGEVAEAIAAGIGGRRGNYLVYFPSYKYLDGVLGRFAALSPSTRLLAQSPGMTEEERGRFLSAFGEERAEMLVGFAVMGGVFGEGIDLVGDRLVGVVVVGVGLPQLCLERDLIRDHFQARNRRGFDYAYAFPGINRVLQAAGRVIRSERDRGVVVLVDERFGEERYRAMFPDGWRMEWLDSAREIEGSVSRFWGSEEEGD